MDIVNPTPLNVPAPQDANGTLIPQHIDAGTQSTLSHVTPPPPSSPDVVPPPSVPVGVEAPQTYPSALADPPPPAAPVMPYEIAPTLARITIEPADSTINNGDPPVQFSATAVFADNSPSRDITASVRWSVSDPTKASFSPDGAGGGLLTPGPGTGHITVFATFEGVVGSTPLFVHPV